MRFREEDWKILRHMTGVQIFASSLFLLGYAFIALEHKFHVNKAAIALVLGAVMWITVALVAPHDYAAYLHEFSGEIFGLVIFLLSAMSLVEILVHYRFFDLIRMKMYSFGLSQQGQFFLITTITFFTSAVLDNLTTTIVMIQIARRFFKGEDLLRAGAAIVIAANAGGAFSPIGDVTTIMLWLAHKFSATEIMHYAFLPALSILFTTMFLLRPKSVVNKDDEPLETACVMTASEKFVIGSVFVSFFLSLVMNALGLPPYMGILLGFGCVWVVIETFKKFDVQCNTHLDADIDKFIKKTDITSLKFFIGILLAVAGLKALGILDSLTHFVYGENPTLMTFLAGNTALGFISAILDNVPLTAIAIESLKSTDPKIWSLLALTVGTGGSLLVIGSAAGVVAMGMLKDLTMKSYLRLASFPALVGYLVAIGVWYAQSLLI